jgi:predicted RNase H-like HicB family nuclease
MRKTRAGRRGKRSAATQEIASFTVHFLPSEDGGYTVEVPALDGCVTEGDTFEEAERNARAAISLYVESLRARGLPSIGLLNCRPARARRHRLPASVRPSRDIM